MTITDAGRLTRIGPVVMDHRNPTFRWTSAPDAHGIRTCSISGQSLRESVQQLSELVANTERRITVAGHSGVLEYLNMTGELVGPKRGFYLLSNFDESAERPWSVARGTNEEAFSPFSLSAVYLGDVSHVQVVISRSARDRGNDFGITPEAVITNPFWDEDAAGSSFASNPGGDRFSREYDALGSGEAPGYATEPMNSMAFLVTEAESFLSTESGELFIA